MRSRWLIVGWTGALVGAGAVVYVAVGDFGAGATQHAQGRADVSTRATNLLSLRGAFSFLPVGAGEYPNDDEHSLKQITSFVWKEPSLTVAPDRKQAGYILEKGRGELLAPFLAESQRALLDKELKDIDEVIRSTAEVYDAVVSAAKTKLSENRPHRVIRIPAAAPATAPERAALVEARKKFEGRLGAVWANVDSKTGDQLHYIVLWEEWPDIRGLLGDLAELTSERRLIIRQWVCEQWQMKGDSFLAEK